MLRVPRERSWRNGWRPRRASALDDHLYLVDPLGNWMMRFPARMDASRRRKAKRDLERLLRASAVLGRAGPLTTARMDTPPALRPLAGRLR